MNRSLANISLFVLAISAGNTTSAAVLADGFPAPDAALVTGAWFENVASNGNVLERVILSSDIELTGFSILSPVVIAGGTSGTFKLQSDASGVPTGINLHIFDAPISIGSSVTYGSTSLNQYIVNFAPITLTAGTYWMGLSGTFEAIGLSIFDVSDDDIGNDFILWGDTVSHSPQGLDYAYRAFGNPIEPAPEVPEPATWGMMIAGLGMIGMAMRRRAAHISFA